MLTGRHKFLVIEILDAANVGRSHAWKFLLSLVAYQGLQATSSSECQQAPIFLLPLPFYSLSLPFFNLKKKFSSCRWIWFSHVPIEYAFSLKENNRKVERFQLEISLQKVAEQVLQRCSKSTALYVRSYL